MKHLLYVNGTSSSQTWTPGCPCRRCRDFSSHRANTSVSLLTFDERDRLIHHVLFDAGDGVVESLARNPYLAFPHTRLDLICLSHWHPDHTLGLNRICTAVRAVRKRHRLDLPFVIPIWCRSGSAAWLEKKNDFEFDRYLYVKESNEYEPSGTLLPPVTLEHEIGVTIEPLTLTHRTADFSVDRTTEVPSTCGFVITTAEKKAILLWDFDDQNQWLFQPGTPTQMKAIRHLQEANYLFISTPWWSKRENGKGHCSFEEGMDIVCNLGPQETFLMHLSGHEMGMDQGAWGWSDAEWTANARQAFRYRGIEGDVKVPQVGETVML